MQTRFVIVPAIPIEKESFQSGSRFYATTVPGGFDIYDNQDKLRLKPSYKTRSLAEAAREKLNSECRNPDELFPLLRWKARNSVTCLLKLCDPLSKQAIYHLMQPRVD